MKEFVLGFFMLLSHWILLTYWRALSEVEVFFGGFALFSWRKPESWAAVAVVMHENAAFASLQSIRHGKKLW